MADREQFYSQSFKHTLKLWHWIRQFFVVPYVNDLALVVSSPEKLYVQAVLRDCLTSHLLVVLLTEVLQICDYCISPSNSSYLNAIHV